MWFQLSSRWPHLPHTHELRLIPLHLQSSNHTAGQHRASCWTISVWQQRQEAEVDPGESIMLLCYGWPWPPCRKTREFPHKDQWRITLHYYFIEFAFESPQDVKIITALFTHSWYDTRPNPKGWMFNFLFCSNLLCEKTKAHKTSQTFGSWCSCNHWIIEAAALNNFSKYFILISQIFCHKEIIKLHFNILIKSNTSQAYYYQANTINNQ